LLQAALSFSTDFEDGSAKTAANTKIRLIHETNYLLDQQLRALEEKFSEEGGFMDKLYRI
jgi:four helix bundle suffix protein